MKMKKILIPFIALFMLAGCVNNESNVSLNSEVSSSESNGSVSESSSKEERVSEFANGSVGGSLIEIDSGDYLLVGQTYTCSFTAADCEDPEVTPEYDASIIKLEFEPYSKTVFKITALKEGETLLRLRSKELDCLVFRQYVSCREEIDQKDIEDFVFSSTDRWLTKPETKQLAGSYKLVVTQTDPFEFTLNGASDLNENVRADFTAKFKCMSRINEFNFYQYQLETDLDTFVGTYVPKLMYISLTGCNILIYDNEGMLINMFYPEEIVSGEK